MASKEFAEAQARQQRAQDVLDIAAVKLAAIQGLANGCFDECDWWRWSSEHPDLALAGLKLSEALIRAIQNRICAAAHAYLTEGRDNHAEVTGMESIETHELIRVLMDGGVVFGQSPLREIHAATINHPRVTRSGTSYQLKGEAERILELMRPIVEAERAEEKQKQVDAEVSVPPFDKTDVPF